MIGFGKDNEEFGKVAPVVQSFEEMCDEEGFANNSLRIRIATWTGMKFEIQFPSYFMFSTRNESYAAFDENEIRQGKYLLVFSESCFLDYYDKAVFHTEDDSYPGRGTHYGIYTSDHLIDVIADVEPILIRLED